MNQSQKVELGANWIHGVLGNPIFEFAISHGLVNIINIPKPHKVVAAMENGKQVPFVVLQEIYQAYICFLKRCEEYFLCQYLPPSGIYSVGSHIHLEIDLYLKNVTDVQERNLKRLIFECLLKRETCITGCDNMDDIDLMEMGSFQELQGGNIVLESGYSSILGPLSEKLADKICLDCPIKTIKWKRKKTVQSPGQLGEILEDEEEESDGNDSDKTITDEPIFNSKTFNSDRNVQIICDNNEIFYADHIICTIPLGCLKENQALFDPKLPTYKKESIERLLFGTVDKIFLEFDRPLLNAEISEVMLLWEPEDSTDCDSTTDDSDFSDHVKKYWYKKIYSFSKISDQTLLGWISGREAEFMETLDEKTISEKCTEILRIFLKDPFIPKPKKCIW